MKTLQKKIKFLTKEEVDKIINSIPNKKKNDLRDRALIQTLFSTGLRIGECLSLKLNQLKEAHKTQEVSIVGKGGFARPVYLSMDTLTAIRKYLTLRFPRGTEDYSQPIFPITIRGVQLMVKKRCENAGFDGGHPHLFRHSFAVYVLNKTGNLRLCQEFLGHKSIQNTQIYLTITNREMHETHQKVFE